MPTRTSSSPWPAGSPPSEADAEGYRYFCDLSDASRTRPCRSRWPALPGPAGRETAAGRSAEVSAALDKLDRAASADLGLPQYLRGLALTALPPDRARAEQAITDLEFVLAVRDLFPAILLRGAFAGLARAHAVLGHDEQAADAARRSGLGPAPAGARLTFGGFWANAEDGFRFTSPRILRPEPGIQIAQGYDFCDLGFITTDTASSPSTPGPPRTGSRPRWATSTSRPTPGSAT